MESLILTCCIPSLDCPSLTPYTNLPTPASGYFSPFMYFKTSELVRLLFHGDILTFLESTSMPFITLISPLNALPTEIALLSLFAMDRVARNLLSVRLLVPCQPVLLDPVEVLYGEIWCDRMSNELWGGSATTSLNFFSCGVLTFSWLI